MPLVRRSPGPGEIHWDPAAGTIDRAGLEGVDAVVHLAGENIGQRWSPAVREGIRNSRVDGTRVLSDALATMARRPAVLVAASAIGIYGDRGADLLTEQSPPGRGFLAETTLAWEAAALPARDAGIRVAQLRLGIVLSPRGGALARMLPIFRLGGGGVLGSGRQWMSWIALDDAVAGFVHAIETPELAGPVNLTTPNPVTNREFTEALGSALSRPTLIAVPAFALRLALGREMADSTVLASARVIPARLTESGFSFRYPGLSPALLHVLGKETLT